MTAALCGAGPQDDAETGTLLAEAWAIGFAAGRAIIAGRAVDAPAGGAVVLADRGKPSSHATLVVERRQGRDVLVWTDAPRP